MSNLDDALQTLAYAPKERLAPEILRAVADEIFAGQAPTEQLTALLMALRMTRESALELTTFVEALLGKALPFPRPDDGEPIVDTCGTGGDGFNTFNISTASALVVAACGVRVAKHGNRSATSQCGSADVLEALGVPIECAPEDSARRLAETGFCFLYARQYHPAVRHATPARKALGFPTLFNFVGPLANPARPSHQVIGVAERKMVEPMAEALRLLGARGALVVHGDDGLDEISLSQVTEGVHLDAEGDTHKWSLSPVEMGVKPVEMADLIGGDPEENARIVRGVLAGQEGPQADVVNLNAAAALWVVGSDRTMVEAFAHARSVQRSGKAAELLRKLQS